MSLIGSGEDAAGGTIVTARFLAIALLRRAKLIMLLSAVTGMVTVIVVLSAHRVFKSAASFTPQSRRSLPGNVAGVASQLGLSIPSGDGGQSPQFYADLLQTADILGSLVDSKFRDDGGPKVSEATLVDIYQISGRTPALRTEGAIKKLRRDMEVSLNPKTDLIRVEVRATSPQLAQDIVTELLRYLDHFNQERRQSQATAERKFTERRLVTAREEARLAEDSLERFLQANRMYEGSPPLRFTFERLSRAVTLRQQVLSMTAQMFEQARLEEVRDTPALTIVEKPSLAAGPESRGIALKTFAAMALTSLLVAMFVIMRALGDRALNEDQGEQEELRLAWSQFLRGLYHPFKSRAKRADDVSAMRQ